MAAALFWTLHDISVADILVPRPVPVVVLEAADGTELVPRRPVRGAPVKRNDLPQHLVDAVLAIEDQRFYSHRGIDPYGILRALMRNLKAGRTVEGGSTITQQLVKTLTGDDQRTLKRKLREAVLAILLERHLTKDEILTRYLDNVYFGAGVTGLEAAARIYFTKPVKDLSLAESALLAGLIRAPSELNPLHNLADARKRAAVVLDALAGNGKADKASVEAARNHPAELTPSSVPAAAGSWFADWAYEEAIKVARSSSAMAAAVRVRTTLSPSLQAVAERVIKAALERHGKKGRFTQAALVAMRPTGEVLAMVGGRNYEESQFNRAVHSARQPGSTFKLFVYFAALRNGYSLNDRISDAPFRIGRWKPRNYNSRYHGWISLEEAFARSLNVATARLAQEVGIGEVVAAAQMLGIDAPLVGRPSLALGAAEVSLLDLTAAYASVRAGVAPVEPLALAAFTSLDPSQSVLAVRRPSQQSLGQYQQPLLELLERVVAGGTGRAAALGSFAAGKTGTTENYRDAWFVGFTDDMVAGVWVGNDDNRSMNRVTGGKIPASIWREFMSEASKPEPAAGEAIEVADASMSCDIQACAAAYRSFRASDCSWQPYRGPRKACQRGATSEIAVADGIVDEAYDQAPAEAESSQLTLLEEPFEMDAVSEEVTGFDEEATEEFADAEVVATMTGASIEHSTASTTASHRANGRCAGGGASGSKARDISTAGCRGSSM
jgi:1A family penicillin-binding protein